MTAGEAASRAAARALRAKGVNDDITVIVVDLVPEEGQRTPFAARAVHSVGSHPAAAPHPASRGLDSLNAWHPLETPSETWRCEGSAPPGIHAAPCCGPGILPRVHSR